MAIARMGTTKQVKDWLRRLEKEADCKIESDFKSAGTAKAISEGVTVFAALQKGKSGPWIIRFINGGVVEWPA